MTSENILVRHCIDILHEPPVTFGLQSYLRLFQETIDPESSSPVHNMQLMAVGNGSHNLPEVLPSHVLRQTLVVAHDVIVQISPIAQFQYQIQLGLGVDDLVQPNHVRVLHELHTSVQGKQAWEMKIVLKNLLAQPSLTALPGTGAPARFRPVWFCRSP